MLPKKLSLLILLLISLFYATPILAETMRSDNFTVRFGNFNMTSGTKSSGNYTLTDTVGQTAASEFSKYGYTVKAGFQYIYTLYDFTFTISDLTIDFGSLIPNNFSTQTNQLSISSPGSAGYSITAQQDHRLENANNTYINDTTCDSSCDHTTADIWTNTSNTGFGFNIQGDNPDSSHDIPADFSSANHFRQFADASLGEIAQVVMSSTSAVKSKSATVTYKLNVDNFQESGDYTNVIIYTATPAY